VYRVRDGCASGDASVTEDDSVDRSKELCLVDPYLEEAPLRSFMVML